MSEEVTTEQQAPAVQQQDERGARKPLGKPKRRPCGFCMNKVAYIDYKDINRLRKYMSEKGKIVARRQTGLCAAHQREVTNAVKRARNMSLI